MKLKLTPEGLREVRRALIRASLARWLARAAAERGDEFSARFYRAENASEISYARLLVDRDFLRQLKERTRQTMQLLAEQFPERFSNEVAVSDEPISESVSAPAAPGQLRLRGVLVQPRASQKDCKPQRVHVQLVSFDGISPRRNVFPRLGKHWAPASLLVGNQERKGHAFLRA
jgi:hypothetical protein